MVLRNIRKFLPARNLSRFKVTSTGPENLIADSIFTQYTDKVYNQTPHMQYY